MNPYDSITFLDGTRMFKNSEAERLEAEVARIVEETLDCRVVRLPKLSDIDWYAERHHRLVGYLELKSRNIAHDAHSTVFLAVRKWLALMFAQFGMGVPGVFVVRFTDGVYWAPISIIDARRFRIGGRTDRGAANDIEPLIEVEIAIMKKLVREAAA